MSAMASKEVTTKQIKSIAFGFYTDDEVRKMAVKQIYNPLTFDNLQKPLPHGLYDPAMGPLEQRGRCETCKLSGTMCPGHFGYVQLPVPVYNPLVFPSLQKLLKTACLHCYHFKMSKLEVDSFLQKLTRLAAGDLVQALGMQMGKGLLNKDLQGIVSEVEDMDNNRMEFTDDVIDGDDDEKADSRGGEGHTRLFEKLTQAAADDVAAKKHQDQGLVHPRAPRPLTSHVLEAMQDTINEFFRRVPNARCQNCGAHAPKIRKYAKTRLFMVWTSQRSVVQNKLSGTVIRHPLSKGQAAVHSMETTVLQELADETAKRANARESVKRAKGEADAALTKAEGDGSEDEEARMVKEDPEESKGKPPAPAAVEDAGALSMSATYMDPAMVEEIMRRLWQAEWPLLHLLYAAELSPLGAPLTPLATAAAAEHSKAYRMFFIRVLPVAPNRFRPPSKIGDDLFDHAHNTVLTKILTAVLDLIDPLARPGEASAGAAAAGDRAVQQWLTIQDLTCQLLDSTVAEKPGESQGIRQTLEKKEGLFRKNMMGKRVNFAARSVISPDPYIGAGEIGVPPFFAARLSFPERVTAFNVERLRHAVLAGANCHPGAVAVENENGNLVNLGNLSLEKREVIAKQLLTTLDSRSKGAKSTASKGGVDLAADGSIAAAAARHKADVDTVLSGKIVYRHLQDGDLMLTNRQPTLHKPGLMAHRARVLKGERTIRMHYSNCATFNADFDGDEINLHLPQDHYGRAEAAGIVHADQQYIVPTDGKPIRGLIQDHVVSGTLMCKRDTFLTRQEYCQLVYAGCTVWMRARKTEPTIHLEPPSIYKPRMLWTGKQVVSTVVRHWTWGLPPLTFSAGGKVPAEYWGSHSGEDSLYFYRGTLVTGVVDKNQFGKYGLVHAVQELYGNSVAGQLLSSFSRLFTYYLQHHGFTCGIDDLLLVGSCERARQALLDRAEAIAINASADFVGVPRLGEEVLAAPREHQRDMMQANIKVCAELSARYRADAAMTGVLHDSKATSVMHPLSSEVIKLCLPKGQVKAFPANCLSTMTVTGAKGSLVNFSQISCLLGQQELEGRRVPRMASGKTLPCFRAYDSGARSGGFVGDRFLTGLRPQEYYFHCMAGREGLVDTTVKTSRSGYLQRCLIKNLESLRVHYDSTVRDNCDGSIVQFYYGEDGLDVLRTNYMRQFGFLARNTQRFAQQLDAKEAAAAGKLARISDAEADIVRRSSARQRLLNVVATAATPAARRKAEGRLAATLPLLALQPPSHLGATSEAFQDALAQYVTNNPDGVLKAAGGAPPSKDWPAQHAADVDTFATLMRLKYMRSLVAPGEAVGVLAAQSVGEPSTQMTLNTFHMAGRGEANVTLGIPRLREILMTASPKIKTPIMTVPIFADRTHEEAQALANRLRRMRLGEALRSITVKESELDMRGGTAGVRHAYTVRLQFFADEQYPPESQLSFAEVVECFKRNFCPRLKTEIEREARRQGAGIGKVDVAALGDAEASAAGAPAGDAEEAAAKPAGRSGKGEKAEDYEEDEELREGKLRFAGGREEAATYDEPDADEAADAAAIAREGARRDGIAAESGEEEEYDGEDSRRDDSCSGQAGAEEEAGQDGPSTSGRSAPAGSRRGRGGGRAGRGGKAAKTPRAARPAKHGTVELSGIGELDDDEGVDLGAHTCEVVLVLPPHSAKLMVLEIVERVAAETVIRLTDKIDKVYVLKGERGEPTRLQLDGINFAAIWQEADVADVNRLTTNDVHAMLHTFGVEAARATVMREVQSVFSAYGIGVDPRHLSLIADFMTQQGGYRACNRLSIDRNVSPFLKMSFETAAHFLTDATLRGSVDDMKSPSSRIVVGRVVDLGTGTVDLMQQLPDIEPLLERNSGVAALPSKESVTPAYTAPAANVRTKSRLHK